MDRYDAIVVGAGLGGLTTAALLARAGWKVLALEAAAHAGGYARAFSRHGYTFDPAIPSCRRRRTSRGCSATWASPARSGWSSTRRSTARTSRACGSTCRTAHDVEVVSDWGEFDLLGLMQQLGVVPGGAAHNGSA